MKRANRNAWRYQLDPRDPDYLEPPEHDEEEPEEPGDDYDDSDPRNHGPRNYIPMRNDV